MRLADYIERIGYQGPLAVTHECLAGIHRCQALAVPYENLDVQLGHPLDQDIARIYDKIVRRRRGGWCYEVNGLLQWALQTIGFDVMRLSAGVHRRERGDAVMGNHLVLQVTLERPYLADLGLGDGIRDPIPLEEGRFRQGGLEFALERLADGHWRFHNHASGNPPTFDFRREPADEGQIATQCRYLQSAPDSSFVQNLSFEIMQPETLTVLTGRVLRHRSAAGIGKRLIETGAELEQVVGEVFGIHDVSFTHLWPRIDARHRLLFGDKSIDEI